MTLIHRVSRTELARHTRRILTDVQRGRLALIESHGQPEAALLDIIDYRLLRAVVRYYASPPETAGDDGLTAQAVAECADSAEAYALVMAHYLSGDISLSRAAELLDMPWLELRTRCLRLDIPVRSAPVDAGEVLQDVTAAEKA